MNYVRTQWDRAGAVAAVILAALVLLFGYLGTADTEFIAEQVPYLISGGLFGIALMTVGAVLWLSADLRDEWRELADQGEAIRQEQLDRRTEIKSYVDQEVARQMSALTGSAASNGTGARRQSARANATRHDVAAER